MPRTEHDFLGDRELPDHAYYGVQTLRATENFPISGVYLHRFPDFVVALVYVKKAAALTNHELRVLTKLQQDAIVGACDEIISGKLHDQFVVDMIQGGAGTSTNMNANEVIANRGLELMGRGKGAYEHLHPNDHVNCSQSTNDAYPTAIKLAVVMAVKGAVTSLGELHAAFEGKEREFADVIKMGRTEEQDAVPMTLGREFGAYATMVREATARIEEAGRHMLGINMGATAIGTGINSPPGYAELVTQKLREVSGIPVLKAANRPRTRGNSWRCRPPSSARLCRSRKSPPTSVSSPRGRAAVSARSSSRHSSPAHRSCRARSIPSCRRWSTRSATRSSAAT